MVWWLLMNSIPFGLRVAARILCVAVLVALPARAFAQTATIAPSTTYEIGFSPGGGALAVVLRAIELAHRSIRVACYEFTNREIADRLLAAARRGVDVAIVADARASEQRYSEIPYLAREGIPVRLDARYAIMHDKFMVIDSGGVETGSFNYTLAAVRENAENALLLRDAPDLAASYLGEWRRLWEESQPSLR